MDGKATLKLRSPHKDNIQHLYHESYDLLHCSYSLKKGTSKTGQVDDRIMSGDITVALAILPNDNIMSWLFDTQKKYNGEITIDDLHSESIEKVYFEEARPVNFRFHYEPGETLNTVLLLTINVQRLVIGNSEFKNNY